MSRSGSGVDWRYIAYPSNPLRAFTGKMLTCFRRGIACNLRGKHLIYKADASWRNMALAVCLSHRIISDYLECLWKNASLPSHALFAPNLCAWTNAKLTTSGNPCTKTATLKDSRKKLRDATRHLDVRKRDENNVDLLDMWSGSRVTRTQVG